MGFGFNLFFSLVFLPGSLLLLIVAGVTRKRIFLQLLAVGWIVVVGMLILSTMTRPLFETIQLEKSDYYGSYVIDRSQFPGRQANWQYNTFRLDIRHNGEVAFYVTDKEEVLKTYLGEMSTVKPYSSHRPIFWMQQPTHHIVSSNPTVYRRGRQFYLVFESPHFGNVFFTKGDWKPIDK